jgi:hypothetical protein
MNDLTIAELRTILGWFKSYEDSEGTYQEDDDVAGALKKTLAEKEELESMDLDDCAGGACKL